MNTSELELTSPKSLNELKSALQRVLAEARAKSIQEIEVPYDPLAVPTESVDLKIVAEGQGLIGGSWAVQIFADEHDEGCDVMLIALGDSGFARAMGGVRNTVSLSKSVQVRDAIAARLRERS